MSVSVLLMVSGVASAVQGGRGACSGWINGKGRIWLVMVGCMEAFRLH